MATRARCASGRSARGGQPLRLRSVRRSCCAPAEPCRFGGEVAGVVLRVDLLVHEPLVWAEPDERIAELPHGRLHISLRPSSARSSRVCQSSSVMVTVASWYPSFSWAVTCRFAASSMSGSIRPRVRFERRPSILRVFGARRWSRFVALVVLIVQFSLCSGLWARILPVDVTAGYWSQSGHFV